MPWENSFNTDSLFVGGAGMFVEYHDIIRLVDLFVVVRMMLTEESFGLPVHILKGMGVAPMTEWYLKRPNQNPFTALDYNHILDIHELDQLRSQILDSDPSIYQYAPYTNFYKMLQLMRDQQIGIPVYVWTPTPEVNIQQDLATMPIHPTYVSGSLESALSKTGNNFTYIFSDISHAKVAADIINDRYAHILIPTEFRYNYQDHMKTLKYTIQKLNIRFSQIPMINYKEIGAAFSKLSEHGGES